MAALGVTGNHSSFPSCLSQAAPSQPFHSNILCGTSGVVPDPTCCSGTARLQGMLDAGGAAHFFPEDKGTHSLPQWTQLWGSELGLSLRVVLSYKVFPHLMSHLLPGGTKPQSPCSNLGNFEEPPSTRAPHGIGRGHCPLSIPPLLSQCVFVH